MEMQFETRVMNLREIKPAEYNPRVTLKKTDHEYRALNASIEENGLVKPLIVNKRTGNLVSGHQRLNVLLAQGVEDTEVVLIDVPLEQEKAICIEMNHIKGRFDYGKLSDILQELSEKGANLLSTGFMTDEIAEIIGDLPEMDIPETEFVEKKEDDSGEIKCIIGEYKFKFEEYEYENLFADIRYKVGFSVQQVNAEIKRRLFENEI